MIFQLEEGDYNGDTGLSRMRDIISQFEEGDYNGDTGLSRMRDIISQLEEEDYNGDRGQGTKLPLIRIYKSDGKIRLRRATI